MRRLALHAGLEEVAALVAVDDAHVGRLADDHHLRRRKVLRNVVDHPADTGAADLLVVGKGDVDRLLERPRPEFGRSEEHTSELQSLMRISYAVFCLKKKKQPTEQYNRRS